MDLCESEGVNLAEAIEIEHIVLFKKARYGMKIEEELAIERITMVKRGCAKWIESAYELAIKALEKQIPKETNKDIKDSEEPADRCPECGCFVMGKYCHDCGQALKWR